MFQRFYKFSIIILLTLCLQSCERKPQTLGSFDKIIILCETNLWSEIELELKKALQVEIITPQPEYIFNLLQREPDNLSDLKRYRNLLLVGTLETPGPTKKLFDKMLTEKARNSILSGENAIFQKPNVWSKDQLLGVVVAKDVENLKMNIAKEQERIFDMFDMHTKEVVTQSMYSGHEKTDIQNQILANHGWSVRIQHDYYCAIDSAKARFVWLRRLGPQRWFSVYYEQVDDPTILSKEWMIETRNRNTKQFYKGDVIVQNDEINVTEKTVNFNDRFAIQLNGIWENNELMLGGPFRSFGFYNKSDERLYLVDIAVFAPGERKFQYIRQLESMAFTFKTRDEN
jgi:hypothetical protein